MFSGAVFDDNPWPFLVCHYFPRFSLQLIYSDCSAAGWEQNLLVVVDQSKQQDVHS